MILDRLLNEWYMSEWVYSISGMIDRGKLKYLEKNLSQCHLVYTRCHNVEDDSTNLHCHENLKLSKM